MNDTIPCGKFKCSNNIYWVLTQKELGETTSEGFLWNPKPKSMHLQPYLMQISFNNIVPLHDENLIFKNLWNVCYLICFYKRLYFNVVFTRGFTNTLCRQRLQTVGHLLQTVKNLLQTVKYLIQAVRYLLRTVKFLLQTVWYWLLDTLWTRVLWVLLVLWI